jgi:hypothetical protein
LEFSKIQREIGIIFLTQFSPKMAIKLMRVIRNKRHLRMIDREHINFVRTKELNRL